MAIISIEQKPLAWYGNELVSIRPKPRHLQRRITVYVPDSVVERKEMQPVFDAYARRMNKPEWIGKPFTFYETELLLSLGFHIVAMDKDLIQKRNQFKIG